jgi:error-prone DNA polymerase
MRYAELHCKTNFSFLEGASHPSELVEQAAALGYHALAVTDRNSLAGVVRAHGAAKDLGLKLLIGAEVSLEDAPPLALLAPDRPAYANLCRLITRGRRSASKGECRLTLEDAAEFGSGLIACVVPPAEEDSFDPSALDACRDAFGDRCHLLCELLYGPRDAARLDWLRSLSRRSGVPLAAAGDVHYHAPERMRLQHVLTAVRLGISIRQAGESLFANAQRHLRPLEEVRRAYARAPDAVERTVEIADRCSFSLEELRYDYPRELAPPGRTPIEHLKRLTWEGAAERYPEGVPDKVRRLLEHELSLIEELRYEAYFLTVHDLVRFARGRNILCQGRGSAANSAVCYCLGITSVDPDRMDVLFERFLSRERNEAPDIDVDFEHERREEVLQYLYEKYGRDRAGLTATVITYRARSAIRDVGKALGLSLDQTDALAKQTEGRGDDEDLAARFRTGGLDPESKLGRDLLELVRGILGFPRHLSQHVGGMVVSESPLCELVPIENAAMPGRTVIQWDKDDLDELGILKVDCLCLGMLTAVRKCFDLIERHGGGRWTLATIPPEDPETYAMIRRADTVGVFQIESRAQMSMLPRLKPACWYDLVIEVAIVRPGPIQGGMVHPYLRRRSGEAPVEYPNDAIRAVLEKTLGVPIFQEQAMRLAMVAAGFTPGEADQLRRAMGAWRRPGVIERFRRRLLEGMRAQGLGEEFAESVYRQIRGFGEYGFPESHAASFALLVYASAWLKRRHPAAYTAALLNSQPLGFYAPAQLVRDARDHGVEVRPADVNASEWDCTLEPSGGGGEHPWALRLGLRMISGLSQRDAEALVRARTAPYRSVQDAAARARLGRGALERLARADAFASLGLSRRAALWQARGAATSVPAGSLLADLADDEPPAPLPAMSEQAEVFADYAAQGLSLRNHPVAFHRRALDALGVAPARALQEMEHLQPVRVAGLVLLRQRPATARGVTFVTLEDETGVANLVIHPRTWERFHRVARRSNAWIASGRVERAGEVVHVVVRTLEDMTDRLQSVRLRSRDFR